MIKRCLGIMFGVVRKAVLAVVQRLTDMGKSIIDRRLEPVPYLGFFQFLDTFVPPFLEPAIAPTSIRVAINVLVKVVPRKKRRPSPIIYALIPFWKLDATGRHTLRLLSCRPERRKPMRSSRFLGRTA